MTRLGEKVKELRVSKGMTQQRLAEKAGVSHSLVSALESGRRKYVVKSDVEGLAKGLGVSADELWRTVPGGQSQDRYIAIESASPSSGRKAA